MANIYEGFCREVFCKIYLFIISILEGVGVLEEWGLFDI